jgi:regulator of protease activity HflC (stomatin/prohibitin superfamily)
MEQDNFMRNVIVIIVAFVISLFIIDAVVGPIYNVWAQSQTGKAELARAESNRQIAVLEAQAKKDSAQQLADAEIIRASGVAKANSIIGESLKDNPAYLQYLWITEGEKDSNRTVYMVPSNGGAPVPTFDIQK